VGGGHGFLLSVAVVVAVFRYPALGTPETAADGVAGVAARSVSGVAAPVVALVAPDVVAVVWLRAAAQATDEFVLPAA